MDISDAKIGVRVSHQKFKNGTITNINKNHVTVLFDEEFEGKNERIFIPGVLSIISSNKLGESNNSISSTSNDSSRASSVKFKVGDNVIHKEHGEGIVIERKGFFRSVVEFKKTKNKISVLNDSLTLVEVNIIDDDELIDDDLASAFKIVPSNYSDQSCYTTEAKRLLTYLRRKYTEDGIATIKSYVDENDGQIGVLIVPTKGIVIYNLISTDYPIDAIYSPMFEMLFKNKYEQLKRYYINAFMQSKNLCKFVNDTYKILKYPVRFVYIFQNIDVSKMTAAEKNKIAIQNKDFYFKNFTTHFQNNDLFSNFEKYDPSFEKINQSVFGSIIERVVPENATLISIAPTDKTTSYKVCNNPEFTPITGKEREFSALYLDDAQIKTINDTKPGHYLTLANPGTGKSVLLVSKAYRIQSIKKDNHVLITCYNNNLAEHHNIFADVSGMKTENLHIKTFHKFAIDIVKQKDPNFFKMHKLEEEKNFDLLIDRFEALINSGNVSTKLNAIFIDEIQLFEPKWIDICYKLLDKASNKDFFFEMFGDINQDVKSQHSRGKASWQNTKLIPSLQGRVRKLDKNYRNTDIIANYLKCMISEFNSYLNQHGIPIDQESSCLTSETMRKGSLRTKILLASNKINDVSKIRRTIEELVEKKHADYNEIAIIYPAKGLGKFYAPLYHIQNELDSKDIPYSLIHGKELTGRDRRQRLYECDGVILSTIDSCLGLDFKYVIICGMHFWDSMKNSKNEFVKLDKKKLLFDKEAQLYLSEIGKKIYSACSRAREGLYIIDDLDSDSPIKEIFRPKSGRRYYDEY